MIVVTKSSTYLVDDDYRWIIRSPGQHTEDWLVAELRRDGERIEVVSCDPPVVGRRWDLLLDLRKDGVLTWRNTTPVVRVEPG